MLSGMANDNSPKVAGMAREKRKAYSCKLGGTTVNQSSLCLH